MADILCVHTCRFVEYLIMIGVDFVCIFEEVRALRIISFMIPVVKQPILTEALLADYSPRTPTKFKDNNEGYSTG